MKRDSLTKKPLNSDIAKKIISSSISCNVNKLAGTHLGREIDREQGPRIKNVCRRAAVVLGRPATFPALPPSVSGKPSSEINLSALPLREKQMFHKRSEGE